MLISRASPTIKAQKTKGVMLPRRAWFRVTSGAAALSSAVAGTAVDARTASVRRVRTRPTRAGRLGFAFDRGERGLPIRRRIASVVTDSGPRDFQQPVAVNM